MSERRDYGQRCIDRSRRIGIGYPEYHHIVRHCTLINLLWKRISLKLKSYNVSSSSYHKLYLCNVLRIFALFGILQVLCCSGFSSPTQIANFASILHSTLLRPCTRHDSKQSRQDSMPTQTQSGTQAGPVFSAITSSTRHIYHLLRCIGFASQANVAISADNIRFSVEDLNSMQGDYHTLQQWGKTYIDESLILSIFIANVCLMPDLFSSYNYTPTLASQENRRTSPRPSSQDEY